MKYDVRREILKWRESMKLSYEDIFKPLGFHSRKACHQFLHSKHFNRYQDLVCRFTDLKSKLEENEGETE